MIIKMDLLENSYDFINSSLLYYSYCNDNPRAWKLTFINLVQGIELMIKEKLRRENKFFVYENIDKPKNTISLSTALDRMINILDIPLAKQDIETIRKAIHIRNQMMHYEVDSSIIELQSNYSILFEFVTSFHYRFLGSELHDNIREELWEVEAELIKFFRSELLIYNAEEVHKNFPKDFLESKYIEEYEIIGIGYPRIRYGNEKYGELKLTFQNKCSECLVKIGEFHVPGCDVEQCPKCYGQAISCDCNYEIEDESIEVNI